MKFNKWTLGLAAVAGLMFATCARAQVATTNAPVSFFGSVGSYLTSSNTNLPATSTAEVSLGAIYQGGVNIASDITLRYKFGGAASTSGFFVEEKTENGGIAGIIISEEAGAGYYIVKNDIELSAAIEGGYRFDVKNGAIGGYVQALKMMTENTYSGIKLGVEYAGNSDAAKIPEIELFTGFKF